VDDAASAAHMVGITPLFEEHDMSTNHTTQASTETVEALAAAELAYRAANVRFHAAVDARDYQGTNEARHEVFIARDALLLARG